MSNHPGHGDLDPTNPNLKLDLNLMTLHMCAKNCFELVKPFMSYCPETVKINKLTTKLTLLCTLKLCLWESCDYHFFITSN